MDPGKFLFFELSNDVLVEGKPFDGTIAGTFVDMYGRKIQVEPDEISEYYKNTVAAIEASREEDGSILGLPIDAKDHDKGDAAGWITGASMEGDLIRYNANWTEIGQELIGKKIRKFFSPTINTLTKVVTGGSLTNWPASKDLKSGKVLLRPIEMSEGRVSYSIFDLEDKDESLEDKFFRVRDAFYTVEWMLDAPSSEVKEVHDEYLIVENQDGYFKIQYSENEEGGLTFDEPDQWKHVKKTWVEAEQPNDLSEGSTSLHSLGTKILKKTSQVRGDEMTVNWGELSDEEKKEVATLAIAELASGSELDIAPLGELIEAKANVMVAEQIKEAEREKGIVEFSAEVTAGSEETPIGLPVSNEQLEAFLGSLDDEQMKAAKTIFKAIIDKGLVNFKEQGHGKTNVDNLRELPEYFTKRLQSGELELAQLSDPMFAAELGDLSEYDLSEFEGK